jgi:hypothetical protein
MGEIELSDAISALRGQLTKALAEGEGEMIRLAAEKIELELQVAATKSADAKVEIKWWLIEAGGGGAAAKTATQTVKLTLVPKIQTAVGLEPGIFTHVETRD